MDRLLTVYRRLRVPGALAALAGNLALTFAFDWSYGWLAVAAAAIGVLDSTNELRQPSGRSPTRTLWIDSTLLGLTMVAIGLPAVSFAFGLWLIVLTTAFARGAVRVALYCYVAGWAIAANVVTWSGAREWTPHEVVVLDWTALLLVGALVISLLEVALTRIKAMEAERTYMMGVVGHELGNSLGSVIANAAILDRHHRALDETERAELVSAIRSEAQESADIADDLLTLASMQRNVLDVQIELIDLVGATENAIRTANPSVQLLAPPTLVAAVDPVRYRQILRNLIINAGRHGGKTVEVHLETTEGGASVLIRDDGAGLSIESASMFGPKPPDRPVRGLGLWVSIRLASEMGGSLTYRREGGWTTFEFSLPQLIDVEEAIGSSD